MGLALRHKRESPEASRIKEAGKTRRKRERIQGAQNTREQRDGVMSEKAKDEGAEPKMRG